MENQSDSEIVPSLRNRIVNKFYVASWSFDKGFWHKDNKSLLSECISQVIMPKKGKCNTEEAEEENQRHFKRLKNKHSAIESNINELENRGLNRCPDKGYDNFKRYIGLAISAFNLRKIGKQILEKEKELIKLAEAA